MLSGKQIKAKDLKYFYMKDKVALDNIGQPNNLIYRCILKLSII